MVFMYNKLPEDAKNVRFIVWFTSFGWLKQ